MSENISPLDRALLSLDGLSVGDAFGEQFFGYPFGAVSFTDEARVEQAIRERELPPPAWHYTDDTQMALSIVSILRQYRGINQPMLAFNFAARYEPGRGYGPAMNWLLPSIRREGQAWRELAQGLFDGSGSFGNGAAMRVAPVGAYFADDLDVVAQHAALSAEVTHMHPEAVAGAVAVAVAAALAWQWGQEKRAPNPKLFFESVLKFVPDSDVRDLIEVARDIPDSTPAQAASVLGSGDLVTAQDTVPFVLWCAARELGNYEEAMWLTVTGLGDRDTTCAMVGGIVSLYTGADGIPTAWRAAREPLPTWPLREQNELL